MAGDIVVQAAGVSKKFCRSLKHVMFYGAKDIARNMMGLSCHPGSLRDGEFWAVDEVSFELNRGETLGIIGPNGSGKSTLLKILSGIFMPDKGEIEIKGKIGALIEVGAGFHPMLTGRENVYINGAILGMNKDEIDRKFDDIVEFAGIGDFFDAPVKHYSSGMFVRLGFAIAIHAEPDVLLVDEVLAVGDANFQKKCFEKILEIRDKGVSIIFVSHSMSTVERLCTKCVLMKNGKQLFYGNTRLGVQEYFREFSVDNLEKAPQAKTVGVGEVTFSNVYVYEEGKDKKNPNIEFGKNIVIEFDYEFLNKKENNNQFRISIRTFEGRDVQKILLMECPFNDNIVYPNEKIVATGKKGTIKVKVLDQKLFPQTFRLDVAVTPVDKDIHLGGIANAATFNILHPTTEKMYLEYGNMTVTEFDYEVNAI